jgi:hypothetical protein
MTVTAKLASIGITAIVLGVAIGGALPPGPAAADPKLFVEIKKQNIPAKDCMYCHTTKAPKKETFKPDELNDRGKWLAAEKKKEGAKEVKADWAKNYPGGLEQK